MKAFFKKLLHFACLLLAILTFISIALFSAPNFIKTPKLANEDYSEILKNQIIIAGDSRAERGLDPSLLFQSTSLNTINIAQTGHDLYTVAKGLLALNIKNKTIILSASSWQANDGAIQGDYFRIEPFSDLSFIDKIYIYRRNIFLLYQRQITQFKNTITLKPDTRNFYNHSRVTNYGFEKIACKDQRTVDAGFFKNHPFYLNADYNGIKLKLLKKALYNLSLLKDCKILIYNGPVTGAFRAAAKQNRIYDLEANYDNMMKSLVKNYTNFKYVSFIDSTNIADRHFYDPQHLCETGVPIFTGMIADIVKR